MPLVSLDEMTSLKELKKPLMSLDLGDKRIGVALSDRTWMIASALTTLDHKKFTTTATEIFQVYETHEVCGLVIGLPLNMDGSEGPRAQSAKDFAHNLLERQPDMPICFWDERLSTVAVETMLIPETDRQVWLAFEQVMCEVFVGSHVDDCQCAHHP